MHNCALKYVSLNGDHVWYKSVCVLISLVSLCVVWWSPSFITSCVLDSGGAHSGLRGVVPHDFLLHHLPYVRKVIDKKQMALPDQMRKSFLDDKAKNLTK